MNNQEASQNAYKYGLEGQKLKKGGQLVFHTVRTKDDGLKRIKCGRKLAVRLFCTECLGWVDDPKDCTATLCPLFPFRGRTQASLKGNKREE